MNARLRYSLAIILLGLLLTGPFLLTLALLMSEMPEGEQGILADLLLPRLPIGVMIRGVGSQLDCPCARQAAVSLAGKAGQPSTHFVTATRAGQLIRVQIAPVLSAAAGDGMLAETVERGIGGYVLMLDNITRAVDNETRRDEILQALTEGSRASLANIRAAVETLLDYPDVEAGQRERFLRIIGDEVVNMGQRHRWA